MEAILKLENRENLLANFINEGIDDAVLSYLTDEDLLNLGIKRIGDRRRLLAAFAQVSKEHGLAVATAMPKASATAPYVNDVGLSFVPIPRFNTLVCIHPIRVLDYRLYCSTKDIAFPDQKNPTGDIHPVVNVSWHEGIDYCLWLTAKERDAGTMGNDQFYRLLTDLEWSSSVGLPNECEETPAERSKQMPAYPWGQGYPPRKGAGNYHQSLKVDDFQFTSPVDAFPPNEHGIYDLSGNVWEWVMDNYNNSRAYHTLRGGAWDFCGSSLLSSARNANDPNGRGTSIGFRIALTSQDTFNQTKN